MYRYNTKIRLGGSVLNEIRRKNISAAEIMILRRLHGTDAVMEVEEVQSEGKPPAEERENLRARYTSGDNERRTRIPFEQMFGPEHIALPDRLPDFARKELEEAIDDAEAEESLNAITG